MIKLRNNIKKTILDRWHSLLLCVLAVVAVALTVWNLLPQDKNDRSRAMAVVMRYGYTQLLADGKDVINIWPDTVYSTAAWVNHVDYVPSSFGLLMTGSYKEKKQHEYTAQELRRLLDESTDSVRHRLDSLRRVDDDLRYYERVHSVMETGFSFVTAYSSQVERSIDSLQQKLKALESIGKTQKLSIRRQNHYVVYFYNDSNKLDYRGCHPTRASSNGRYQFYQTDNVRTPSGTVVLKRKKYFHELTDVSFVSLYGAIAQKAVLRRNPAFYDLPHRRGVTDDKGVFRRIGSYLVSGHYNADTLVGGTRIDSVGGVYIGDMDRRGHAHGAGSYYSSDAGYYGGFWKDNMRSGFGFSIAPGKHFRAGEWKDDRYHGEKVTYNPNRIYGIDVSRYQHIVYRKVTETVRVRRGRRRTRRWVRVKRTRVKEFHYNFDWDDVRITSLGSMTRKNIEGKVDYKITFAYVKATEGSSLYNTYYKYDYEHARKAGIRVGTYHFLSTTSPASSQAWFFLKKGIFRKGDFPPVLDVEPSREQIRKMGGTHVLFEKMRTWLKIVEKETGVKPVLYVSQKFVDRYLSGAPDLKRDYQVWIARYGEYKPDIRLAWWQLAPDGRVKGIRVPVDISVFNGYNSEYGNFVRNYCIQK